MDEVGGEGQGLGYPPPGDRPPVAPLQPPAVLRVGGFVDAVAVPFVPPVGECADRAGVDGENVNAVGSRQGTGLGRHEVAVARQGGVGKPGRDEQ